MTAKLVLRDQERLSIRLTPNHFMLFTISTKDPSISVESRMVEEGDERDAVVEEVI